MFKKKKIEEVEAALDRRIIYYEFGFKVGRRKFRFRPWIEHWYYDGDWYVLNLGWWYICYRR